MSDFIDMLLAFNRFKAVIQSFFFKTACKVKCLYLTSFGDLPLQPSSEVSHDVAKTWDVLYGYCHPT